MLFALADDSMRGRRMGTADAARAARMLAAEMRAIGLEAGGDSGYFQRVPLAVISSEGGRDRMGLAESFAALDSLPPERRRPDVNVVGVLRGSDPSLREEAIVVGAHFDHVGVGQPVEGDSINNGADDDASGVVATLEIARMMARGPAPKRTVVFVLTTGEEGAGFAGSNWYIRNPVIPMERTVADLQIEMIGRPDPLAGGTGKIWITGAERSTLAELLRRGGVDVGVDPRPALDLFNRSDNIAFARRGIVAHTLSTYNGHSDYHRPSDEPDAIDYPHLTRVVEQGARAVRVMADGPAPQWNPGGRPAPR